MRRALILLAVVLGSASCAGGSHSTARTANSPSSTPSDTSAPAASATSFADRLDIYLADLPAVHEEAIADLGGGVRLVVTEDWSNNKLRATFSTPGGTLHAVSNDLHVYVHAPEQLLRTLLGSTVAAKSRGGTRWVRISTADEAWGKASFLSDDPIEQFEADQLVDKGPGPVIGGAKTHKLTATINSNVFVGASRGKLTVYAAVAPKPMPVSYTFTSSGGTVHAKFSHWERRVSITFPQGAVEDTAE